MPRYKKRAKTIDAYIDRFPKDVAARLCAIRKIVHETAPEAEEVISYHMPAFKLNGMLVYFAAFAHHIGMYPYTSAMKGFQKELTEYRAGVGTIRFPLDRPLPASLIRKIVKCRVKENLAKKTKRRAS